MEEQERDITAHQGYYSEDDGAAVVEADNEEVNKVLPFRARILQPLRTRISQLLGHAGPHRVVVTGDVARRCLAFIETELTIIAATTLSQQQKDSLRGVITSAEHILHEVDPSRHTRQRRASRCFGRRNSYLLLYDTLRLYYTSEDSSRYSHLLASSDLGLTHQLAKPEPEPSVLPLLGIDRPTKKILRWLGLTHRGKMDMNRRVMSIVGPVGIGKTTLAREIRSRLRYHETSAGRNYFECNIMVQASQGTGRNIRLLQDILSQVSEQAAASAKLLSDDPSQKLLVHLVSMSLRDKRYLLIIDDIWETSDWDKIEGAFPHNNLGCRILVTTRSTSTARACCSAYYDGPVHEMKPLSEMDSERLLVATAVGSVDGCLPNNMKLLCDEILRRCDGIPFFIVGMAYWLKEQRLLKPHQQENKEHQRYATMHYEEQVPRLPERLEQALSSAFKDLSNDDELRLQAYTPAREKNDDELRLLLLYMSMFPYGYKFDKDRLTLKWIHEGPTNCEVFTEEHKGKVERLFSQLVDRNVLTCVASNCNHKQDEADACQWQVNHFMHQFLASKSAEMGFIFTTSMLNLLAAASTATASTSSRMPRRLALHHPDLQLLLLHESTDLSQTRSLAVSGVVDGIPLERFVNLVLLDLEGWENLKDEDLILVCRSKMVFLRYLSVRNTRVLKLTHEIKELRILKTLDISYTQITGLPHEIKELRSLKALYISYTQISELPLELFDLTDLEHLDLRGTRISQLSKQIVGLQGCLRHLLVGGEGTVNSMETPIPHNVRYLSRLQTLATIDLTQQPASLIRALGDLHSLKVLAVKWSFHQSTDKESCEALLSSIRNWENLESLTIHCGLGCSMEFLGSLEKPPQRLEKFKVTVGRFASVPLWINGLKHLAFVQITVCNRQTTTNDLKILGDLPKLQCLILGLDFIPGQPIVIENRGFLGLQRFSIYCPMPWLTFSTRAMPELTYLQLKLCSNPVRQICVPSGICNLRMLTKIALCYSVHYINSPSVKMTVEAVTKQVAEHGNPIDLSINGFELDDVQEADDEVKENTIGASRTSTSAEDDAQVVGEEVTTEIQCEITEAES